MAFEVTRDGTLGRVQVEVSFDPSQFSLRELLRVEDVIGPDDAGRFLRGELDVTPRTLHAVIYTKLASQIPGLEPHEFDIPADVIAQVDWS